MASRNISVRLQVEGGAFKAELIEAGRTGQQALKQIETGANQASAALEKTAASAQKTDRESQQLARPAKPVVEQVMALQFREHVRAQIRFKQGVDPRHL